MGLHPPITASAIQHQTAAPLLTRMRRMRWQGCRRTGRRTCRTVIVRNGIGGSGCNAFDLATTGQWQCFVATMPDSTIPLQSAKSPQTQVSNIVYRTMKRDQRKLLPEAAGSAAGTGDI